MITVIFANNADHLAYNIENVNIGSGRVANPSLYIRYPRTKWGSSSSSFAVAIGWNSSRPFWESDRINWFSSRARRTDSKSTWNNNVKLDKLLGIDIKPKWHVVFNGPSPIGTVSITTVAHNIYCKERPHQDCHSWQNLWCRCSIRSPKTNLYIDIYKVQHVPHSSKNYLPTPLYYCEGSVVPCT